MALILAPTLAVAQGQYVYSPNSVPVRFDPSADAATGATIEPGQAFEIIKWNNFNTRIRMADGRIGWIDKSLVGHLAPANNPGFLENPISLTATNDQNLQGRSIGGDMVTASTSTANLVAPVPRDRPASFNAESTNSDEDPASGYAANYDSGTDLEDNSQLSNLLTRVRSEAWEAATKRRRVADFCGGGFRTGNRSKCMCAQAVKEALVSSGVCQSYPAGHALQTHTRGTLRRSCNKLQLTGQTDPWKAAGGSVIVYSGYAGNRVHNYGHIEIKIPVTSEFKDSLGRAGRGLQVGTFLYCSDFCAARPTKTANNRVAAIYSLKGG